MLKKVVRKLVFAFLLLFIVKSNIVFAAPYNMCTGKEFNDRVKMYLSGGDSNITKNYTITIFERGYNPPDDKAYYVDISEDNDGTVIAYARDNVLYYYSDSDVVINENCAYMFDKFIRIRNIDLSGFVYFGLKDTRYMFASCHHLHTLKFKKANKKNENVKKYELSEMQGMFFDCQSLTSIDLSRFDTIRVNNMDEVFYKCYNLKNIYVDKASWKIENVYSFNRMFSLCHMLKTNLGRKAVDIASDDYEQYAIVGTGKDVIISKDIREGFLKDINTEYADYGERDGSAPIDGDDYTVDNTAPTITFADEPEGEIGNGNGGSMSGDGTGITPFVGDKSTGYYAEKEQQIAEQVITPTTGISPINDKVEQSSIVEKEKVITQESIGEQNQQIKEETFNNKDLQEQNHTNESIVINNNDIETENNSIDKKAQIVEEDIENENQPKIMELDEYLKSKGIEEGSGGKGNGNANEEFNYQFLIFALIVSIIAILLLVGAITYLLSDKKDNKDAEKYIDNEK